jgi:glutathione S-transferase
LHDGLTPRDPDGSFPLLAAWFVAMEKLPAYACRVQGDAASWRKVLSMAGYGNAGVPSRVLRRMDEAAAIDAFGGEQLVSKDTWSAYAATRPHVAPSAAAEAASTVVRNRDAILADVAKRQPLSDGAGADAALRAVADLLLLTSGGSDGGGGGDGGASRATAGVGALASFLDTRMCVPRDMGAPAAAVLKRLAAELNT